MEQVVFFIFLVVWLVGSQFPDQELNPSYSSGIAESQPPDLPGDSLSSHILSPCSPTPTAQAHLVPFLACYPSLAAPILNSSFAPLALLTSPQLGSCPGLCSEEGILHIPSSTFLFANSVLSLHLFSVFHLFSNLLCVKCTCE